jgi:putative tributyrin esterase
MKKFCGGMFLCFSIFTLNSFAQQRLQFISFYSKDVHDTMRVRVLLPANYKPTLRYPVLFLLHGYGGDETDWTTKTGIENYTADLSLIIIMPEAKNSWYVNSKTISEARYEDYIVDELPKYINSVYRLDTTREAIAGLSMGGYGALMLALRHPQKYIFAGDLSGAITIPGVIDSVMAHPHMPIPGQQGAIYPSILKAFGDTDKKFRDEHNVFALLQRERDSSIPYIYCVVGIQDGYKSFLPAHREFTNLLYEYGKMYEYHEIPGEHDWKFWDEEIQPLLARMSIVMHLDKR